MKSDPAQIMLRWYVLAGVADYRPYPRPSYWWRDGKYPGGSVVLSVRPTEIMARAEAEVVRASMPGARVRVVVRPTHIPLYVGRLV